ncbi:hypothetical protein [Staphylococcus pseudintermedius]|uniref:hypothetical protein n=1 Tax=Staphylococcus pseudintermedius TaxID=283734 RepID=UPI00080C7F5F|nr:hypothetical protein [Staphylococcus pseudintermedius]EGQ1293237.1 hypothetical protein [Staphylococcus pseudintermedius]EGQ1611483.1 hypothetical protein [Staphylococcus pseudintermedius]EGQ1655321.1 hypothetical protein [Staphylococcus pseudintermedius]EGQ1700127.1 hypothetical protein [Staphylococcus pseudintermedius]EGQ1719081.1 hypothetical protein [Staphylococcus pseudintermedius]
MAKVILGNRKITVQPSRFDIVINRSLGRVLGNHTYSSLTINDVSYDIESMVVSDTSITVLLSNDQYNLSGVVTAKVVFFRDDSKTEWRVVVDVLPSLVRSATAEYDSNLLSTQSYVKRRGLNGTIVNRREVE